MFSIGVPLSLESKSMEKQEAAYRQVYKTIPGW